MSSREHVLATAVVELARALDEDFDVLDFLQALATRTEELFEGATAMLMLADQRGSLRLVAASAHGADVGQALPLARVPAIQAYDTGAPVVHGPFAGRDSATPSLTPDHGYRWGNALPLRLRDEVLGSLVLLSRSEDPVDDDEVQILEAVAEIVTLGLFQDRGPRDREQLAVQLQTALNLRIALEQATGMAAELLGVPIDSALAALDAHARQTGRGLSAVARSVIAGRIDAATLAVHVRRGDADR